MNGLNQYTSAGPASFTYDANGNLQGDGSWTYTWDVENRLVKAVQGATTVNLAYDPLGRLYQTDKGTSGTTTNFVYDADALALEYDDRGDVANRYVHGSNAAADDPLVWYSGRTLGMQYFLHADRLGSIAGIADQNGAKSVIQTYDEYGINGTRAKNERFGYTGQAYIPELGLYYYKNRLYSPTLGRFLQTDPIGHEGGINVYAYVRNDPVNHMDPSGESITELGFLIYDVGTAASHIANGAAAGEILNDAVNIGLDIEPIPGLREVKGAVEVGRAIEDGVRTVRVERAVGGQVGKHVCANWQETISLARRTVDGSTRK